MSEQERVPFWQVWRLRLRALLGWGMDVPDLRLWAQFYVRGVRILPLFMIAYVALLIVMFNILPHMGIGVAQPVPVSSVMGRSLPLLVIALLLMAVFSYLYVRLSRRAEAGELQALATLDGHCYATVIAPPMRLFALIGMTRELAQWFCLPIGWDPTVEPGADRFELTCNPTTGYVERLRRIGAEPRELRQGAEAKLGEGESAETDMADGEATPAQRRELIRDFQRAGMTWGVSTASLLLKGLALLIVGVSASAMTIVLVVVISAYPQYQTRMVDALIEVVYCAFFLLLDVGLLFWGALVLRKWARQRRADAEPPLVIEGEQVFWASYRDLGGARDESLARIRLDDGEQRIFRIPVRWAHRVRQPNARVRVTYKAGSGRVLDYRVVDAPPTRTSA